MSETSISYPSFPRRFLLMAVAVALVLAAGAIALNTTMLDQRGDGVRACTVAAARIMAARGYSADMMQLTGPAAVRACRGLSARQYRRALAATYLIEYGGHLSREPLSRDLPPPSFRARSAHSAANALTQGAWRCGCRNG